MSSSSESLPSSASSTVAAAANCFDTEPASSTDVTDSGTLRSRSAMPYAFANTCSPFRAAPTTQPGVESEFQRASSASVRATASRGAGETAASPRSGERAGTCAITASGIPAARNAVVMPAIMARALDIMSAVQLLDGLHRRAPLALQQTRRLLRITQHAEHVLTRNLAQVIIAPAATSEFLEQHRIG